MFEIQILDDQGQWRDDIVSDYPEDNRFATVAEAEAAMKDLISQRGIWPIPEWRVEEVMET